MRHFQHLIALLLVAPGLGGCLATLENGPERLYSEEEQGQLIRATLPPLDFRQACDEPSRNNYITARMYAVDLKFTTYFSSLTKERQLGTLGADLAVIGLGGATAVIGGAQTKAVLGAATTAIAGAKSAVDKDVLLSQTVQILQNEMEVQRSSIRGRIYTNLKNTCSQYTVAQGLSDLEDYYRAGTLAGALESLSSAVGKASQQQKDLKNDGVQAETLNRVTSQ